MQFVQVSKEQGLSNMNLITYKKSLLQFVLKVKLESCEIDWL